MGVLKNWSFYAHAISSLPFFIIREDIRFMASGFQLDLQAKRRKGYTLFLAFFWFAGIVLGIWISVLAGTPLLSLMRSNFGSAVSIVGLLLAACFPFLISVFTVLISGPGWLLPVGFANGFLHGYICLAVIRSFGSAGWLLRLLLCFSIVSSAPVLYLFWLRLISRGKDGFFSETLFFFALTVLIGSIDYSLVSPFLADLIF